MKSVTKQGAQGDVLFTRVDKLSATAVEVKRKKGTAIVVAHSETGHHHTIAAPDVRFYEEPGNPLLAYLVLGGGAADVVHSREYDQHETLRLKGGKGAVWDVRRQREGAPDGWRRVED